MKKNAQAIVPKCLLFTLFWEPHGRIYPTSLEAFEAEQGAVAGLVVIVMSLFVAIFAYFLAPDSTAYANRMVLEIGGQRPGFSVHMLSLHQSHAPEKEVFSTGLSMVKRPPTCWSR